MISANLSFLFDKIDKYFLICGPVFQNISGWREKTDKSNIKSKVITYTMFNFGVIDNCIDFFTIIEIFRTHVMQKLGDFDYIIENNGKTSENKNLLMVE